MKKDNCAICENVDASRRLKPRTWPVGVPGRHLGSDLEMHLSCLSCRSRGVQNCANETKRTPRLPVAPLLVLCQPRIQRAQDLTTARSPRSLRGTVLPEACPGQAIACRGCERARKTRNTLMNQGIPGNRECTCRSRHPPGSDPAVECRADLACSFSWRQTNKVSFMFCSHLSTRWPGRT